MTPCPEEPSLRSLLAERLDPGEQTAVAQHVEQCARCQALLASLSENPDTDQWRRLCDDRPAPAVDQWFLDALMRTEPQLPALAEDRWPAVEGCEILEELGRGGMGVVYKARQIALNRIVALKMLRGGAHATDEDRRRFRKEAEAVAQVRHPHIVQVHDVRESDGAAFLVMEYVAGGSLARLLRGAPQSLRDTAALVETLALAMHHVHQAGIVHRDLKPANILLVSGAWSADTTHHSPLTTHQPKITDFGLAKLLDVGASPEERTRSGATLGTPSYMAPEQAGAPGVIGPATDVYALGAILYEMLTGRPPFLGATPMATLLQVLHEEPVPPGRLRGDPRERNLRDLETICLMCLRKEATQRYESAQALADDLRRYLDGAPIRARPVGAPERLSRWARRRPFLVSLLAVAVCSSVVAVASLAWALAQTAEQAEVEHRAAETARLARDREADSRRATERMLYFSRITQARMHWQENQVAQAEALLDLCRPGRDGGDLRGWEWHYLKRLCHSELRELRQRFWVQGLAYSPDGRTLAVASGSPGEGVGNPARDGELQLWDTATGRVLHTLRGHTGRVERVAFRPDGRQLLSVGVDGLRLWDVSAPDRPVLFLAGRDWEFTPDFRFLAGRSATDIDTIRSWDGRTGQELRSWPLKEQASPHRLALSADGERLAALDMGGTLHVWDTPTGDEQWSRAVGKAGSVVYSPDGRTLVAFLIDFTFKVWDAAGRELVEGTRPGMLRKSTVFTADGRFLIGAPSWENRLRCWALEGTTFHDWPMQVGAINDAALSSDGRLLATAGDDQTVRVWTVPDAVEVQVLRGHAAGVVRVAFSPDGKTLASGDREGIVKLWALSHDQRGIMLPKSGLHGEYFADLAFAPGPSEKPAVLGLHSLNLQRWQGGDVQSMPESRRLEWRGSVYFCPRTDAAFSNDGLTLAAVSKDGMEVLLADPTTAEVRRSLRGHQGPLLSVAISSDGRRVASAAHRTAELNAPPEGVIKVWDGTTGKELSSFAGPLVTCLAFSPDARHLAAADREGRLHVWDALAGRELFTAVGHVGPVYAVAFHPDGSLLASAGFADAQVRLWDARPESPTRGQAVAGPPLRGGASLTSVAFSPDGGRVAATGYEGRVFLWDTSSGQEIMTLRGLSVPRLGAYAFSARVVFSRDGRWLAANNWDGSVTVWDGGP